MQTGQQEFQASQQEVQRQKGEKQYLLEAEVADVEHTDRSTRGSKVKG
jgi:hypothetical protein